MVKRKNFKNLLAEIRTSQNTYSGKTTQGQRDVGLGEGAAGSCGQLETKLIAKVMQWCDSVIFDEPLFNLQIGFAENIDEVKLCMNVESDFKSMLCKVRYSVLVAG